MRRMDKEVLIHVRGLQTMDADGEQEPLEIVVPGQYYFCLLYTSSPEDIQEFVRHNSLGIADVKKLENLDESIDRCV